MREIDREVRDIENTYVLRGWVKAVMNLPIIQYVPYVHMPTMKNKHQHYNPFSLIQNERKATEFCHIIREIRRGAIIIRPVFIVF